MISGGTYKFNGNDILISFPYDKKIVSEVRWIPGARFNPELKAWVVPLIEINHMRIANFLMKYDFEEEEEEYIKAVQEINYDEGDFNLLDESLSELDLIFKPRKYQKETILYSLDKKRIIIADEMGLGKTFSSIVSVELANAFPVLVVTPASIKYNFAEQWQKYTGRKSVSVIETKGQNNWEADVVVINYDILGKLVDNGKVDKEGRVVKELQMRFEQLTNVNWKAVIFDEAHFLKNKKAARSQAARKISKGIDYRFLLTGTPIINKPKDIINLLELLGVFKETFSSWKKFVYRYCNAKNTPFGLDYEGASNVIELNQKLRDTCFIRHEKQEVLTELPPVVKSVLNAPISNKKEYSEAEQDLFKVLMREDPEKAMSSLNAEHLSLGTKLRQLTVKGKLKYIEQYLKDFSEGEEKLVIFGFHREPLEYLSKKFKCDAILGSLSSEKKHKMVQDFKTNKKQFLFLNWESGGTGVDGLQEVCSNMLLIELPWTPAKLDQIISRLDRSGQESTSVNVNFILDLDTIDKEMWEILEEKEEITEGVNKGIDVDKEGVGLKKVLKKIKKGLQC